MKKYEIHEIHEEVLKYLLEYKKAHPDFTFGLRKMNNSNRLKKGYWFNGNEKYVAIPFYTGRDWKNKTPNIFFKIGEYGHSFLEFSFSDSPGKRILIDRIKANIDDIEVHGRGYMMDYHTTDFINALSKFLTVHKPVIDDLIKLYLHLFEAEKKYNKVDFYSENEFQKSLHKISLYRDSDSKKKIGLSQYIQSITITNNRPKINVEIDAISDKARWIFLTGKNGVGKSTILKGIAAVLIGGKLPAENELHRHSIIPDSTCVTLNMGIDAKDVVLELKNGELNDHENKPVFSGYGPTRHITHKIENGELTEDKAIRLATCRSLFFDDALMYNLDMELFTLRFIEKRGLSMDQAIPKTILLQIIELIPKLIPGLKRIEAPLESTVEDLWSDTEYVFEDENEIEFNGVGFDELSSGHKNLINFLGDMLIRLLFNQAITEDITELKGIVIIDEIDIHLHPIYQKAVVEALADELPNVQFIVSTHSPIPLLGAPKESIFLKVKRTAEHGVTVEKLEIDVRNLLPNTLLSSPIFGMLDLTNPEYDEMRLLKSEDNYDETVFYSILDKMIEKSKSRLDEKN